MDKKVLSLDISTKTGWCLSEITSDNFLLKEYGTLVKVDKPDFKYPKDYLEWAHKCSKAILEVCVKHKPDVIIIEETSKGSKNNFSQKILEFIHFLIAEYIVNNEIEVVYYRTGEWRDITATKMNLEEKKHNKIVNESHKKGIKVVKKDGKRIGKLGKKHINIRRCNELFNLSLIRKDEDTADAILLNYAFYIKNRSLL